MKFYSKILIPALVSVIVFLSLSATAQLRDSVRLLADNKISGYKRPEIIQLEKAANVLYPSSLQMHREQSIDYVEKFSNAKRAYLIDIYEKGKEFFPKVETILKQYDLPEELKVLLALESGFNGNAVSRAGAVGYWQMMNAAAKKYGLNISYTRGSSRHKWKITDERKNLLKSTCAAAKYLRDQCENFDNDLLLAVASYNCGLGNVLKAIKKSGKKDADFWDIKTYLPAETRNYVMNFIALNVIFLNYDDFSNNSLFAPKFYAAFPDKNIIIPPPQVD